MTLGEWVSIVVGLVSFLGAQVVAIMIVRRQERKREERQRAEDRKAQLGEMRNIIDADIGRVGKEVERVAVSVEQAREEIREVDQKHTHQYEHLKDSRPTRGEMEKEMKGLKQLVTNQGNSQHEAIDNGFKAMDRRFDEFKDYMREIAKANKRE